MSIGYFIGLGDKTGCGGEVLEGDYGISWHGVIHALEGHKVSCAEDGETYEIVGGVSSFTSSGRRVAGTLDSFSSCPCRAQFLPSVLTASYHGKANVLVAPAQTAKPTVPVTPLRNAYDEQFRLVDLRERPHSTLKYLLLQDGQLVASGTLDSRGCCDSQCSPARSHMAIAIHAPSPGLE